MNDNVKQVTNTLDEIAKVRRSPAWSVESTLMRFLAIHGFAQGIAIGATSFGVVSYDLLNPALFWVLLGISATIILLLNVIIYFHWTIRRARLLEDVCKRLDATLSELEKQNSRVELWYKKYRMSNERLNDLRPYLAFVFMVLSQIELTEASKKRVAKLMTSWEEENHETNESDSNS